MAVTVRQKIKGKGKPWWVFVAHDGNRKSMKVGDRKAADAVASEITKKLKIGEFNLKEKKKVPTFGDYSKEWVEGYIKTMRRYSTHEKYDQLLKGHILPVFKDKGLDQISRGKSGIFWFQRFKMGIPGQAFVSCGMS
ncbi:MAG: hypothetical protein JRJ86_21235 [Deltaproteobacteria bacterium]|nr:hypothetical protein [Deltaproteobacteria bacterium]